MTLSRPRRPLRTSTAIGLVLLIVASVVHYLVDHRVLPQGNPADFAQGLLYGAAIAAMLLGMWRHSRSCRLERSRAD